MESINLEQLIKQHIQLGHVSAKGFHAVLCKVCNDHGGKGLRAGFKFDNGTVGYHCFNCKHDAKYVPGSTLNDKMIIVLSAFGIPEDSYKIIAFNAIRDTKNNIKSQLTIQPAIYSPIIVPMLEHFYYLKDANPNDKWKIIAEDYLENRGIDYTKYPFMLSTGESEYGKKWKGRVIIPIFKDNNLIYYTGRALVNSIKRYETPAYSKTNVLYGYDQLFVNRDVPLFVTEGFFDAFLVNGVALLGNELTDGHKHWLNLSNRKKVYIPDKSGDGWEIALQCINQGWSVSIPVSPIDNKPDIKDINDAILKYGKLYVIRELMQNIVDGKAAELLLKRYCTDYGKVKYKKR